MYILLIVVILVLVVLFGFFSGADRQVLLGRSHVLRHNGVDRTYKLYVPKKLRGQPSLLIAFNGLGGSGWQMAYYAALHNSTPKDMLVAYPDAVLPNERGVRQGWNAGFCCGSGYVSKADDVGFIKELVATLKRQYNINPDKIFAVGFSNGGMFVQRLATELHGEIAGFASVAGTIGTSKSTLKPTQPVPMLLIHGEKDAIVLAAGGASTSYPDITWRSFAETAKAWEEANTCSEAQTEKQPDITITRYKTCEAPLETHLYTKNKHMWPDWRLFNIWHKKNEGSATTINFFSSL
jgi:polyhydroxybutyrate depolymerase